MLKVLVSLFCFIFFISESSARCNGTYANHLINSRFTNCNGDLAARARGLGTINVDVTQICMDGCYSATFNTELVPECNRRYAEALGRSTELVSAAREMNCSDSGSFIPNSSEQAVVHTADTSCQWLARSSVAVTCNGQSANVCGTAGNNICSGEVICAHSFDLSGQRVPAGVHKASCLTSGNCESVSFETCFSDTNTSPNINDYKYHEGVRSTINSLQDGVN